MEAFGAAASAAQLMTLINGMLRLIREVYDELKNGPQRIRERIQYLDSLVNTLQLIRHVKSLNCNEVTSQLQAIGRKVTLLSACLHKNAQATSKRPLRRLWGALLSIKVEDTICEALIAIEYDKNSLNLSISTISAGLTYDIAWLNQTRMDPCLAEEAREGALNRGNRLPAPITQSSSTLANQLIKRKMLPHSGPDMKAAPKQAAQGARSSDAKVLGSGSSTNTQDHWQRPEPQQPALQSAATVWAARMSPIQEGDLSVGNITVGERGSFIRGNTLDPPCESTRDRKWIGDVKVGIDANVLDQNQGWDFPDSAFQQDRNKTSDAPQSPPEQASDKPDSHESHGPGASCCRLL